MYEDYVRDEFGQVSESTFLDISDKFPAVCVVGLGYVGLPLAVCISSRYPVVGLDLSQHRIDSLNRGFDGTGEVASEAIVNNSNLRFTTDLSDTADCNVYIVTVPTPIDHNNLPDLQPLQSATESIAKVLSKGDIVIYESTVYPGVTEEFCGEILERLTGFEFNTDFYLGYSPERINPGDKARSIKSIIKVTSGSTPEVASWIDDFYGSVIEAGTHLAPSIKVAEAAKVIENTQRDVNIALMNEIAIILGEMNIKVSDVLDAAKTKWNFLPFSPGLVGGHCIGVDPYYLLHKAQSLGYTPNLILASRQINNSVVKHISDKAISLLVAEGKVVIASRALIMGVSFKENCPDTRNSKAIEVLDSLSSHGITCDVVDPVVGEKDLKALNVGQYFQSIDSVSEEYDIIIICVAHSEFLSLSKSIFESISKGDPLVLDVKSIYPDATWSFQ